MVVHVRTVGPATFAYCRHCEHKRWESEGVEVTLDDAMETAARIEPGKPQR